MPENRPKIVPPSIQLHLTLEMPYNTYFLGDLLVRSQALLEQERALEKRTVSIIDLQQRLRAVENIMKIQIRKKTQFHVKVSQGREERIGRNNLINSEKLEIQMNRLQTEQYY
ncbi:MAG: hypothetical protein EZS28_051644 [Streblomastix strix]|uniref:Uncharacterized protein n=1 Tax=Streblomastix strix TaxID=222440 RepID=A0A5J4T5R3_9EUKA|nr:MAG: hypothetical protein EZS28_051644 [Streblomastix strix]